MESLNPLCDALYTYAMEYRAAAFLHTNKQEERENLRMVESAIQNLNSMGPAAADWAERIQNGLDAISAIQEQAAFLAGLSIGLELGALGHGM